jgi:light-regulated signal transduction histidine kinase (bacteriophytochrome)
MIPFLVFAGLILLTLSGIIIWLYRTYVFPMVHLKEYAGKITSGQYEIQPAAGTPAEFQALAEKLRILDRENKILQNKLETKSQEVERTTRSLDNFAYVVSHDLKAPFNSIKSIAELFRLEYADKFDDSGKELLHFIDLKVEEMDKLLMGILMYSRVRQNEAAVESVDVNEEVNSVIKEINPEENVKINIKNKLPVINIERDLMHKLLFNLIDNSVKHKDKTKEISLIEIGTERTNGSNAIYIKDNGVGIDKKYFEKIFNIFYQVKDHTTESEGTGVGLAIAKKIVEYKSGQIWVDSEPKKGSTFYFTIPQLSEH